MMKELAVTLWRSYARGRREKHTFRSFIDTFVKSPEVVRDKRSVAGYSLASFDENRRSLARIEQVFGLVLDFDHGNPSIEKIAKVFKGAACIIYTTFSYTKETPRFRAVLPHSRPISAYEHDRIWWWAKEQCQKAGLEIDAVARDASHFFFLPSHRPGAEYRLREFSGKPLDVDHMLATLPTLPIEQTPAIWKSGRACEHCGDRFTPASFHSHYCSTACATANAPFSERKAAENRWQELLTRTNKIEDYPDECPICRRPWRMLLRKGKNGVWRCFEKYHYDGNEKWIWACIDCNLLERTIRQRDPKRWPRGIEPNELKKLGSHTPIGITCQPGQSNGLPRDNSASGRDWHLALKLMREGRSDEEVFEELRQTSVKLKKGGDSYIAYTVTKARRAHESFAPRMRVQSAAFNCLAPRFGHPELRRVELKLMSEDGEMSEAKITVPAPWYSHSAAVWAACLPDVDPESLLGSWEETKAAWKRIKWRHRQFLVAIRDGEVRWIKAAPV